MSDEREVVRVNTGDKGGTLIRSADDTAKPSASATASDGDAGSAIDESMHEEYRALSRDERKARLATVLDRGVVHERLKVDIPAHLHGEWIRRHPLDIDRMRTLGFWVDEKYATRRAIHSDGTSGNQVGDVIFMVTTRDNKELIDEVRKEQQLRSARNPKEAIEETKERGGVPREIPTFSESSQRSVNIHDVKEALSKVGE